MSDYEWYRYSGQEWHLRNQPAGNSTVAHEAEKTRTVIYDANGQPYARPQQPMGFDLTRRRNQK